MSGPLQYYPYISVTLKILMEKNVFHMLLCNPYNLGAIYKSEQPKRAAFYMEDIPVQRLSDLPKATGLLSKFCLELFSQPQPLAQAQAQYFTVVGSNKRVLVS